jgi:hypothetical protein
MANKNLFKSVVGKLLPVTDAVNDERAPAYALTPKHALAQYAATGCLNKTFYASAEEKLAKLPCGGTNCSAPLAFLNKRRMTGDLVIYVSDNESWIDAPQYGRFGGNATATLTEWARFKERNPQARLVCIDIQPNGTVQAKEREDVLNIGGFSDAVFGLVAEFAAGRLNDAHWIGVIEEVTL